jgi:low temperature requirement protein LtrA
VPVASGDRVALHALAYVESAVGWDAMGLSDSRIEPGAARGRRGGYTRGVHGPVLYVRDGGRHASWLELFFDLVFVLAVAQLGRYLHDHLTAAGVLAFLFLLLTVWSAWMGFSYFSDLFDVDTPAFRIATLAAMLLSIAVAVSIPTAFQGGAAAFAAAYATLRILLVGLYAWAGRYVVSARSMLRWYFVGFSIGALLWVVSIFVPVPAAYGLWFVALAIEVTVPFLAQLAVRHEMPVQTSHLAERFGLFTLVVLGESVVVTGTAVSGTDWNWPAVLTASAGFVIVACLWWQYFDRVDEGAVERAYSGSVRDLVRGYAWAYGHVLVYAGLAATAVGIEMSIAAAAGPASTVVDAHAADTGDQLHGAAVFGVGLAASVLAITWVQSLSPPPLPRAAVLVRWALVGLALIVGVWGSWLPPLAQVGLLAIAMVGVVVMSVRFVDGSSSAD